MAVFSSQGQAFNQTRQAYLATALAVADTHWTRLRGLLGLRSSDFRNGSGLWIVPCHGVHTLGMGFPIDVVYLDRRHDGDSHPAMICSPGGLLRSGPQAASVLELPCRTAAETRTAVGDKIEITIEKDGRVPPRVIETLELEEAVVELYDAPKLLVDWSSPWQEFVTSIRPALVRSERRLAGEAPFGLIPLRIMIPSYVLEAFLIFAAIVVQVKIAELRPFVAPRFSSHDVIYYSGDELPRTEDLGGAEAGTTRPRRRRRSAPSHADHQDRPRRLSGSQSRGRAEPQASFLARCGREPAGHQAQSRSAAFGRIALHPHRAESGGRLSLPLRT